MQYDQELVRISSKDMAVAVNSTEETSVALDGESEIDWPAYFAPEGDDYAIERPCYKPGTKRSWLEQYEHRIFPAALIVLKEVGASTRFNYSDEFVDAVLQSIGDSGSLSGLTWHKRWRDDKSLFYSLKSMLNSHYIVNKKYRVRYLHEYSPDGKRYCDNCNSHDQCRFRDESHVATVKSRQIISLERYIQHFTAFNKNIDAWSDEYIDVLARNIELDIAEAILAKRDTIKYIG